MTSPRVCAAYVCDAPATTTRSITRLRRRENPATDGWALDEPVTIHVCAHHITAPSYQLDIG